MSGDICRRVWFFAPTGHRQGEGTVTFSEETKLSGKLGWWKWRVRVLLRRGITVVLHGSIKSEFGP